MANVTRNVVASALVPGDVCMHGDFSGQQWLVLAVRDVNGGDRSIKMTSVTVTFMRANGTLFKIHGSPTLGYTLISPSRSAA